MKKLIIIADDFSPREKINTGIFKTIGEGEITSVASFVNFDNGLNTINSAESVFKLNSIVAGRHISFTSRLPIVDYSLIPHLTGSN